jgi:hypothetical protein
MVMVKNNVTFDDFRRRMKIVFLLAANVNYFWWLPVARRAQGIEGRTGVVSGFRWKGGGGG